VRTPFSLAVVLPVESERWSCMGYCRQVHVQLRTDLFKGVAMHPEKRNKLLRPLLASVVLFSSTSEEVHYDALNVWFRSR
jgi:hypothetical protein